MKILLMHVPLDDPTMPYHATAYLAGQLRANGYLDVVARDLNAEFVDHCLKPATVALNLEEKSKRLKTFQESGKLNALQQDEYLRLWTSASHSPEDVAVAVTQMRNQDAFLDYDAYRHSVTVVNEYFGLLGALSFPAQINNFVLSTGGSFSIYSLDDLLNHELTERACFPFVRYFRQHLRSDRQILEADCIGLSVIYDYQLPYAFWFGQELKRLYPGKLIVFGGTAISKYYKHLNDRANLRRLFVACDVIVVGEGETAICEIAESGGDLRKLASATNTITYDNALDLLHIPAKITYENVAALPPPAYSYQWDLYLSPKRAINYSPTRGCYWNRCTFCDYGLNEDKPTSPWRERKVDQVVADLQAAVTSQGVNYVYFAVDVMAPGYLERLADAIIQANLKIRWSAEVRMEKIFSLDRCRKLAAAGCVCISFGMESGNQRILDLIDKGTRVEFMAETMKNFSEAGIAVQLMAFHGFPTETDAEREATVDFVRQNKDYWSTGGMGAFLLTGSAIIAKQPQRFGVELIQIQGADSTRAWAYKATTADGKPRGSQTLLTEEYDASFSDSGSLFPRVYSRPWAGGTDSLHSMIYYGHYGRKFFRENPLPANSKPSHSVADLAGKQLRLKARLSESAFDIGSVSATAVSRKRHRTQLISEYREPTYSQLLDWQSSRSASLEPSADPSCWIASATHSMKLDRSTYALLCEAAGSKRPLGELMTSLSENDRIRFTVYLKRLFAAGLVDLADSPESEQVSHGFYTPGLLANPPRSSAAFIPSA